MVIQNIVKKILVINRGQADYERYSWRGASVYCPGDTRPWRGGGHTDVHTHELPQHVVRLPWREEADVRIAC